MSRILSIAAQEALHDEATDQVFLILLTIMHPNLLTPIRVTSDSVATVSRGHEYISYPFELRLPDESEHKSPRARLKIDAVDQMILRLIEQMTSAPVIKIEIILASQPDVVEASFDNFKLMHITYNQKYIEGELTIDDFTNEAYPKGAFTPGLFPSIF